MLSGTALEAEGVIPGYPFVDPVSGAEVNLWSFRQRTALVLGFLHEGCPRCRAFAGDLAAVKEDLEWSGALARVVSSENEQLPVPVLLDPARLGTRKFLGEGYELPLVLVVDRYGAASASFPAAGHRFPPAEEVAATVTHLALQCPECGVSHWPAGNRR